MHSSTQITDINLDGTVDTVAHHQDQDKLLAKLTSKVIASSVVGRP